MITSYLKRSKVYILLVFIILIIIAASCRKTPVPKPKGYFRIDLPVKKYIAFSEPQRADDIPLKFEYPEYGRISTNPQNPDEPGWFNIEFPGYKARIYLTYKDVNNDLAELIEQTYTMNVKNHITKADAINEQVIDDSKDHVYGILYDLKGNTATSVQFYVTDSVKHYLRGSLYFESEPNADSLEPVIEFFREDIIHLIETLKWGK
jgi:gliding motility-associated lipoprotein GldD